MNQPHRLDVHRVAVTTVQVTDGAGTRFLYPAVAVWADLTPMRAAGCPLGLDGRDLPVVDTTAAGLCEDGTAMSLAVLDTTTPHGQAPGALLPAFAFTVPTVFAGLVLSLTTTPLELRILLIDGPAPAEPETAVVDLAEVGAMVRLDEELLRDPLATVMPSVWTVPMPVEIVPHTEDSPTRSMRDMLWEMSSGVALGQIPAWNRLMSFAEFMQESAASPTSRADLADGETRRRVDAVYATAETLLTNAAAWRRPAALGDDTVPRLPPRMMSHAPVFTTQVNPTALGHASCGASFADLVANHGIGQALVATVVYAAIQANQVVTDGVLGPGHHTTSYTLGRWTDEDSDEPWWAIRPTLGLLLHHDTEVLTDLLAARPDSAGLDEVTATMRRFLHVVAEATGAFDLDPDRLTAALYAQEVRPANFADVAHVARVLAESVQAAEADPAGTGCPGCVAAEHLVATTADLDRLAAASVGLMPMLADLDADVAGFDVGGEDWVAHRSGWMAHWLQHTVADMIA